MVKRVCAPIINLVSTIEDIRNILSRIEEGLDYLTDHLDTPEEKIQ